ncbi:carboxypeptidase-like regulatory domain-containing protein [Hymenobacter monticola]|uniref:TonB-dependent receptor n=1 Tax=Hymenobacter monticola TaxID=1705399 RepID=A0ABY4B263_9BACT|nr:TonB-dependent receptor [Hymenobacter monticola]UOE32894.1 TonB-dependent receptor [Hymenobacter monticola]
MYLRFPLLGLCLLLLLLGSGPARAQGRVTLSGTVKDASSGENLSGATIRVVELPGVGTGANAYGFFTLTVPAGTYTVEVSFVGFSTQKRSVTATASQRLDFKLAPGGSELTEVVVTARSTDAGISKAQMGVETIDLKQIAKVPVLFGEKDVIKTLTLLPGIKSAGEGSSGFTVRGGAVDQNLILLDEAPVYNASHLLGFFSTFNSDAIKDLTVYKGGMPAQYGGRLSSVVDIKMKDGNNQQLHGSGGIGLIASRLALEGPIIKDKGSFLVTARRTYADIFLKLSSNPTTRQSSLYFYDLNAKANYVLNERNRVFFSGYLGRDALGFSNTFGQTYGNQTGTLRWNHLFTDRIFSNTSLIFSKYDYQIKISSNDRNFSIDSKIQDWNLKQDFEFYPSSAQTLRFGGQAIYHTITPGHVTADASSGINATADKTNYSLETAAYVSHDWQAAPRLNFTTGLRLSAFSLLGPGTYSSYDAAGNVLAATDYARNKFLKTYVKLEPRFAASLQLNEASSVKASYARNVQNLHLLSNANASSPTDLYIPTSFNVKPEVADQVSAGYYRTLGAKKGYSMTVEAYYKDLQNQLDYRDGTQLQGNFDVEASLLYGTGRAYGIEFLVRKDVGRLSGWLGYTLSRSERKFTEINQGVYFPSRQDRTHDLSVVAIYQLNPKWSFSGTFVTSTGNAVTFPVGKYQIGNQIVSYFGRRNADRMPYYQRLDLGATYEKPHQEGHRFHSSWTFSVYNALGRENAYSIRFEADPNDPSRTRAVQTALFKFIPSATYNFSF